MKRLLVFSAILGFILISCKKDVDLYYDEGDKTVIYSILDIDADTNYFRITKSSLNGDYYYDEDDIDVYFTGLFKNENTIDTVKLGTLTKTEDGQKRSLYFTTKKLLNGTDYELFVIRKEDDVKVSAKVKTICNFGFTKPTIYPYIDFKIVALRSIEWISKDVSLDDKINAGYFTVLGYFHYRELMPGALDTVDRYMRWDFGSGKANDMFNTTNAYYYVNYTPVLFFHLLDIDEYLLNNSPYGVQRWLKDFEFKVYVTGEDLYYYNISNNEGGHYPEVHSYSNVKNGIGVLSSCYSLSTFRTIEQVCRIKIAQNYPYGFIYDPNR